MNKVIVEIKDKHSEVKVVVPHFDEDPTIYDMAQALRQALLGMGYCQASVDKILIGEEG